MGKKKIVTLRNKTAALWDMTLCRMVDRFWRVSGQTSCQLWAKKSTQNMRAARSTVAVALTYRTTRRHEPQHLDHGIHCCNSFISHYGAVFPIKMCHTAWGHNHGPPGTPAARLRRVADITTVMRAATSFLVVSSSTLHRLVPSVTDPQKYRVPSSRNA